LKRQGFPLDLLPKVCRGTEVLGGLRRRLGRVPSGVPVFAALGDMQCAARAAGIGRGKAILNVNTSAQLAFLRQSEFKPWDQEQRLPSSVEDVPFDGDVFVAVAASLNGGNALSRFVDLLQSWTSDLGLPFASKEEIWSKIGKRSPADLCDYVFLYSSPGRKLRRLAL